MTRVVSERAGTVPGRGRAGLCLSFWVLHLALRRQACEVCRLHHARQALTASLVSPLLLQQAQREPHFLYQSAFGRVAAVLYLGQGITTAFASKWLQIRRSLPFVLKVHSSFQGYREKTALASQGSILATS